jgi:hypothetical protein
MTVEPGAGDVCQRCGAPVRVEHVDDTSIEDSGVEHRRPQLVCECPEGPTIEPG